jgi:hypothetical protein
MLPVADLWVSHQRVNDITPDPRREEQTMHEDDWGSLEQLSVGLESKARNRPTHRKGGSEFTSTFKTRLEKENREFDTNDVVGRRR